MRSYRGRQLPMGHSPHQGDNLPHNVAGAPDGSREGERTSVNEHEGGIFDDPGTDHSNGGGDHGVVDVHPVIDVR